MPSTILRLALSTIAAAVLSACGTSAVNQTVGTAATTAPSISQQQAPQVLRVDLAQGIYELVFSPCQNALFVASAGDARDAASPSRIFRLNPQTLAVEAETVLERKAFGLVLDDAANRLYIGNTLDGSVTVFDTAKGQVTGTIQLVEKTTMTGPDGKQQEGYARNFRELVLDTSHQRLYAPGMALKDSALYVVNTQKLQTEKVLPGMGFIATGVTLDAQAARLYVSNFQGQLFSIDTETLQVQRKDEVQGDQLINLRWDGKRNRLLATDQGMTRIDAFRGQLGGLENYAKRGDGNQVVVIDPADGSTVAKVPTGNGALALLLDEARNVLYVTNREAGTVTVHDANDYRLLHTIELPAHPNSLALDEASGALFVSVKNGESDPKGSNESVVRISW